MRRRMFDRVNVVPLAGVLGVVCVLVLLGSQLDARETEAIALDQSPRDFFRPPEEMPKFVVVSVGMDGALSVMGRPVAPGGLGDALRTEFTPDADIPVYVRADAEVPYGVVVKAYQQVEGAGYRGRVRVMNEDIE
ncbi:MAG: ExbD/TolR family protein [Pseudomonadota bacterium]